MAPLPNLGNHEHAVVEVSHREREIAHEPRSPRHVRKMHDEWYVMARRYGAA